MTRELNEALEELNPSNDEPKALHRCRVRLKRARALGQVGKPVAPGLAAVFAESARTVARQLGRARASAALAETARTTAEAAGHRAATALIKTAESLDCMRAEDAALDLDRVRAGIRDLLALAQVWPQPSPRQIRAGAKRIGARAYNARRRGLGANKAALRHRWRKREQERLVAARLLHHAWPGRRWRKKGEELTHLLGLEHDAAVLLDRLESEPMLAGDPDAARRARRALHKRCAKLKRRADRAAVRLGG
jgi:hypothetical protein